MSIKKVGRVESYYTDGVVIHPDYSLTIANDGTITGTVVYSCDVKLISRLPKMNSLHPRDSRCEAYNLDLTYKGLNRVELVVSYFGLTSPKTTPIISYSPNTDRSTIETHPDFTSFAGTKEEPKNGAKFDDETGEFLGFFDPKNKDLYGVRNYYTSATIVQVSYWQSNVPSVSRRMSIVSSIPGFRKPSDVRNFLLTDIPYRQIGSFYNITEQYLGSGPNGWSRTIYP